MQINTKHNFIWNMVASIVSSAASMILLIFITRMNGVADSGIFSIAFATAQMMLTIGWFGMRTYQATDICEQYSFEVYIGSRVISCILMLSISVVYIKFLGYTGYKFYITISMCIFKMLDAIGDVFEGQFHQKGRLDLAAKSLFYRTLISLIAFITILYVTHNLLTATILSSIIGVFLIILFCVIPIKKYYKLSCSFNYRVIKSLFKECMPLFLSNFLIIYIYNVPKYAIDRYMTLEIQAYYNILFMPASVINLFSGFIFRPMLTVLANAYTDNINKFKSIINKLMLWIGIITFITVIGGITVGVYILAVVSNLELVQYRLELTLILIGGGFSALVSLGFHVMTIMRKQNVLLAAYTIGAILTTILSPLCVIKMGILGASLGYMITMFLCAIIFIGLLMCFIFKRQKEVS